MEEAALIIEGLDPSDNIKFIKRRAHRDPLSTKMEVALINNGLDPSKDIKLTKRKAHGDPLSRQVEDIALIT